jgi:hypothetical protein
VISTPAFYPFLSHHHHRSPTKEIKKTTDQQQHKPLASSDSFLVAACFSWQKQKERRDRFE